LHGVGGQGKGHAAADGQVAVTQIGGQSRRGRSPLLLDGQAFAQARLIQSFLKSAGRMRRNLIIEMKKWNSYA
jgi:hypothetical protein